MLPNQSVEVCADKQDWMIAGQEAIQKWATAVDRWGHMKVVTCGQSADLTIKMEGFDSAGLNYFTERPGRILLRSSASGNLLKALALHEFGHSFGLCDQYKDAGGANCSDDRSERQQNDEVMGATTPNKLNLTMGDIEGVRKATSDLTIKANSQWKNFLLNFKPDQNGNRPYYVRIQDGSSPDRARLAISVAQGATVAVCRFKVGLTECSSASNDAIALQKAQTINGRDIYVPTQEISGLASVSKTVFLITVKNNSGTQNKRFAINKK